MSRAKTTPLGLEMVAEPDPVVPAGLVLYRLTAANHGMDDAVQTTLRVTLPVRCEGCPG